MKKNPDIINLKDVLKKDREQHQENKLKEQSETIEETTELDFEWSSPSHERAPASRQWLTLWLIASLTIVIVALVFKNFLFALFLAIASATIIITKHREPELLNIKISSAGIKINENLYRLQDIKSFWIDYEPPVFKNLILTLKTGMVRKIYLPLDKENPVKIRRALINYLPEVEETRSLTDAFSKFLKL
jgi:hypothetical protein